MSQPHASPPTAPRRDVGPMALMFTGLGSIIGSGWLFGAWRAAGDEAWGCDMRCSCGRRGSPVMARIERDSRITR